jgi:hypothetical protein
MDCLFGPFTRGDISRIRIWSFLEALGSLMFLLDGSDQVSQLRNPAHPGPPARGTFLIPGCRRSKHRPIFKAPLPTSPRLRRAGRGATTAAIFFLHRGTLHRTVRTKDTAVTGLRAQQCLAVRAFVEKLACVGRHRFSFCKAANGIHQNGFEKNFAHTQFNFCTASSSLGT